MKKKLPPALPPEELDKFAQEELDRIARLETIVFSPDRSLPERRDAMAEIKGICMRAGSMLLQSPEIKASGTAAGRSKAAQRREPSDQRMQETIAKYEGRRGLAKLVAKELGVSPKTVSRHMKKRK
jgi:hypothetical protein